MENRGLLFIPDISGFTRFVNETEIEHSRMIIEELLELLINSNQIGLKVSEIEGDAILFYRFGESPSLGEIYKQVEKMFCEFHRHLASYDMRKFCQCKACISAIDLTLKIITHYGEFTGYNVKNFSKLIGRDIIVAHQLLKNDISHHEYWLVTKNLVPERPPEGLAQWMVWDSSAKKTESGEIAFHYTQLSPLKDVVVTEPPPRPDFSKKKKVLTLTRDYSTDIITLFHATGDFHYRHKWLEGVKSVEKVSHLLPRIGMKCRCVMETGEAVIYSSSYSFSQERIEFSETNEKSRTSVYYTLEKTGENSSRLTIDYLIPPRFGEPLLFNLTSKRKTQRMLKRSLANLDKLIPEVK